MNFLPFFRIRSKRSQGKLSQVSPSSNFLQSSMLSQHACNEKVYLKLSIPMCHVETPVYLLTPHPKLYGHASHKCSVNFPLGFKLNSHKLWNLRNACPYNVRRLSYLGGGGLIYILHQLVLTLCDIDLQFNDLDSNNAQT